MLVIVTHTFVSPSFLTEHMVSSIQCSRSVSGSVLSSKFDTPFLCVGYRNDVGTHMRTVHSTGAVYPLLVGPRIGIVKGIADYTNRFHALEWTAGHKRRQKNVEAEIFNTFTTSSSHSLYNY